MLILVVATTLLGSLLLFLVEPMAAKMILPRLGGSPSVWIACMLFFQLALLLGYGYAHVLTRAERRWTQVLVHGTVLAAALLLLPVAIPSGWTSASGEPPVLWVLALLARMVGLPFVALACMGPLLQRWYASSGRPGAEDPYFLYAAGNVGSLAGLLAYPLLLEPNLPLARSGLASQSGLWSAGFAVAAVATMTTGALTSGDRHPLPSASVGPHTTLRQAITWIGLAAVPSSVLLGATQFVTTDVAAIPFLWVLPLALYLLTFVVAFSARLRLPRLLVDVAFVLSVLAVIVVRWVGVQLPAPIAVAVHLCAVATTGLLCHGRLAASRPPVSELTSYYWWIAVGGALGGVFNALLAPLLFDSIVEYPLALLAACALRPGLLPPRSRLGFAPDLALPAVLALLIARVPLESFQWGSVTQPPLWLVGAVTAALLLASVRPLAFVSGLAVVAFLSDLPLPVGTRTLHQRRTFFGVHRVIEVHPEPLQVKGPAGDLKSLPLKPYHSLYHGTTCHGTQYPDPELRGMASSYYHRTGPLGQIFQAFASDRRLERVGVIGLGTGTIAAYGQPGRTFTFFEIDPEVVRVARDPRWFTYLSDSASPVDVVVGDGRLALAGVPDGRFGLLVVDAFSSDAIPVHLATREAVRLYARKLRPDGLLAMHVTNRHLDLTRVLAVIAADLGMSAREQFDRSADFEQFLERKDISQWVVLARDTASLGALAADPRWSPLLPPPGDASRFLWTDDRSDLLGTLKGE